MEKQQYERGDKITFRLLTETGHIQTWNKVYYSDVASMNYIRSSIIKSIEEKRTGNELVIGGWFKGVYYDQSALFGKNHAEKTKFPVRISCNLKSISASNYLQHIDKNWVAMKVKFRYNDETLERIIRINPNDFINGYDLNNN